MPSEFNPAFHPRAPAGNPRGGQFINSQRVVDALRKAAGLPYEDMSAAIRGGGFSRSLDGAQPQSGYVVSTSKRTEFSKPVDQITAKDVADYTNKNIRGIDRKDYYIGGWNDKGIGFLDVSKNVFSRAVAIAYALRADQASIYVVGDGYLERGKDY